MGSSYEEFTVFVTGFEAFKEAYPINPSWEIAKRLPKYLPAAAPRDPQPSPPAAPRPAPVELPPVRIEVHPRPIHVGYAAVRAAVPALWRGKDPSRRPPRVDVMLHIGMAGSEAQYEVERRGHRDGYDLPDVDGVQLEDRERREREGKDWVWDGVPKELLTDVDLDDVLARWKDYSPEDAKALCISEDAGHFLCDFIYMSSLAYLFKRGERRRVVFLHVPSHAGGADIAKGVAIATELIRALAESEFHRQNQA